MKTISLFITSLFVLIVLGCGSGKVGLRGTVTYSDDGTPLEAGTVSFQTETFFARGIINKDGTYITSSVSAKDGLPPGRYKVYISGANHQIGVTAGGMPILEPLVDAKYESPETSGLVVDVDRSTRTFDIQVDRASGSRMP